MQVRVRETSTISWMCACALKTIIQCCVQWANQAPRGEHRLQGQTLCDKENSHLCECVPGESVPRVGHRSASMARQPRFKRQHFLFGQTPSTEISECGGKPRTFVTDGRMPGKLSCWIGCLHFFFVNSLGILGQERSLNRGIRGCKRRWLENLQ